MGRTCTHIQQSLHGQMQVAMWFEVPFSSRALLLLAAHVLESAVAFAEVSSGWFLLP